MLVTILSLTNNLIFSLNCFLNILKKLENNNKYLSLNSIS